MGNVSHRDEESGLPPTDTVQDALDDLQAQIDALVAGGVPDGDKGDITVSGSGTAWAVDSNAITLSKLADIATASLLGRATSGTGDPEVLSAAQVTELLSTVTSGLKGLAPASGGGTTNFLRADGSWAAPPGADGSGEVLYLLSDLDPTGATACTADMLTALEYARDNGYGGVQFPPGDFRFTRHATAGTQPYTTLCSIDLDGREGFSDFVIAGAGPGTRLFMSDPDSSDWYLIRIRDGVQRIVIRDLLLDGNYTSTYGTGTLTLTANASNNETVTLGVKTYTFKTALTPAANEVLIGATASDSIDNLIAAINAGAGSGTLYGAGTTANAAASAAAGAGDTMTITALVTSPAGLLPVTRETLTNGSWASDHIQDSVTEQNHLIRVGGGTVNSTTAKKVTIQNCFITNCRGDGINIIGNTAGYGVLTVTANPANNETVTVGSTTYTFKTTLTGAANEILIGASAEASMDNLVSAVNGSAGAGSTYGTGTVENALADAEDLSGTAVGFTANVDTAVATTETLTNGSFTASTLTQDYALTDEMLITGNYVYGTYRTGIGVQRGCRKIVIDKNIVWPAKRGVIDFEPTGSAVSNDSLYGNASQQFLITNNVLVRTTNNNTVCTLFGIGATDRDDYSIFANNLCLGGGLDGLNVGPLLITNNVIRGNPLPGGDSVGLIKLWRGAYDILISGNLIERPLPSATYIDSSSRGVISFSVQPANNDTVTIGSQVYTFKTALTPTAGEVLRGANLAAAMTNLASAINGTGTPGTDYASSTVPNAAVRAESSSTAVICEPTVSTTTAVSESAANGTWVVSGPCIEIIESGGTQPDRINITGNHIRQYTSGNGIQMDSVNNVSVKGNSVYSYDGTASGINGVVHTSTSSSAHVYVDDNTFVGNLGGGTFNNCVRFATAGNLSYHGASGNSCAGAAGGIGWNGTPSQIPTVTGNRLLGVTTPFSSAPSPICIDGNSGQIAFYQGSGAPSHTAAKGSVYYRTDGTAGSGGAAGTLRYLNTDGATTWVALIDG